MSPRWVTWLVKHICALVIRSPFGLSASERFTMVLRRCALAQGPWVLALAQQVRKVKRFLLFVLVGFVVVVLRCVACLNLLANWVELALETGYQP